MRQAIGDYPIEGLKAEEANPLDIQTITLEEAIAVSDTWIHDPNIWFRDLSAALKRMINAAEPPAGRYMKRDWCEAQPDFDKKAEALEIIYTVGLGNFGGPPSAMPKHRYSWEGQLPALGSGREVTA